MMSGTAQAQPGRSRSANRRGTASATAALTTAAVATQPYHRMAGPS